MFTLAILKLCIVTVPLFAFKTGVAPKPKWTPIMEKIMEECSSATSDVGDSIYEARLRLQSCIMSYQTRFHCKIVTSLAVAIQMGTSLCGYIVVKTPAEVIDNVQKRISWNMKVHRLFHLRVSVVHFNLPLSRSRCDERAIEYVSIRAGLSKLASNDILLCGKVLPVSYIINHNTGTVLYTCFDWTFCNGQFLLRYEVFEPGRVIRRPTSSLRMVYRVTSEGPHLQLKDLPVFFKAVPYNKNTAMGLISLHFIEHKLFCLSLNMLANNDLASKWDTRVFEGPGPSPAHFRRDSHLLTKGNSVRISGFQGYLQVECLVFRTVIDVCSQITVNYKWEKVSHIKQMLVGKLTVLEHPSNDIPCTDSVQEELAHQIPSLIMCYFMLTAENHLKAEITSLSFDGPDFLGSATNEKACAFAGVTFFDGLTGDYGEQDLSFMHRIEPVFPGVTVCRKVAFRPQLGGRNIKPTWELPTKTFITFTWKLVILVYAYGGYVDLPSLRLKITIKESEATGMSLTCPLVDQQLYSTIGNKRAEKPSVSRQIMHNLCSNGLALYYDIQYPLQYPRSGSKLIHAKYIFCTMGQQTTLYVSTYYENAFVAQYFPSDNRPEATLCNLRPVVVEGISFKYMLRYRVLLYSPCLRLKLDHDIFGLYTVLESGREKIKNTTLALPFTSWTGTGTANSLALRFSGKCIRFEIVIDNLDPPCAQQEDENFNLSPISIISDLHDDIRHGLNRQMKCAKYSLNITRERTLYTTYVTNDVRVLKGYVPISKDLFVPQLGRELGNSGTTLNVNQKSCWLYCRNLTLVVGYQNLLSRNYVFIYWSLPKETTVVSVANSGTGSWMVYILSHTRDGLCPSGTVSEGNNGTCVLNLTAKFSLNETTSVDNLQASSGHPETFAGYHYFWGPDYLSWEAANDTCRASSMYLASVTTEDELNIVKGLLWGEGYQRNMTPNEEWIVTPCRMESDVCFIYIGLLVDDAGIPQWTDRRPAGFQRWNEVHYPGNGPAEIRVTDVDLRLQEHSLEKLIRDVGRYLQPQHVNGSNCVGLLGTPGPYIMEFVSVPCSEALEVSGVLCITEPQRLKLTSSISYSLHHWRTVPKPYLSVNLVPNIFPHFNTGRYAVPKLLGSTAKAKSFVEEIYTRNVTAIIAYEERRIKQHLTEDTGWPWDEQIHRCSTGQIGEVLAVCTFFSNLRGKAQHKIHHLQKDVVIAEPTSGVESVQFEAGTLTGHFFCPISWTLISGQCIRPLLVGYFIPNKTLMNEVCSKHEPRSQALLMPTEDDDEDKVEDLVERWNLGPTACFASTNEPLVLGKGKENILPNSNVHFTICSKMPSMPKCPLGHFVCDSEECLPYVFLCDGIANCPGGEDESNCEEICFVSFGDVDREFCQHLCHVDNCTCAGVFFQCGAGGCLHSSKLCDGKLDCSDGSDESICPANEDEQLGMSGPHTPSLINDFFPDFLNGSDEQSYSKILKNPNSPHPTGCDTVSEVPCMIGHPTCYKLDSMCLYDIDERKRLKFCRNGLHLRRCAQFECSGSYKCRLSYCVPTHRVCDGTKDCPYGDDELGCPLLSCSTMLRCNTGQCLHPKYVCDGVPQCEDGRDELVCNAPTCIENCLCMGHSIACSSTHLVYLPKSISSVIILILQRAERIRLTPKSFNSFTRMLMLEISNSKLSSFLFMGTQCGLENLVLLNISMNLVAHLPGKTFECLSSLRTLDLSWNPLYKLEHLTFGGLENLKVLLLHFSHLLELRIDLFIHFGHLSFVNLSHSQLSKLDVSCKLIPTVDLIDLRGNVLESIIDIGLAECLHTTTIISDQPGFYCMMKKTKLRNLSKYISEKNCTYLLLWSKLHITMWPLVCLAGFLNMAALLYTFVTSEGVLFLNGMLAMSDILSVMLAAIILIFDTHYESGFLFHQAHFYKNRVCEFTIFLSFLYLQSATWSLVFLAISRYAGVVKNARLTSKLSVVSGTLVLFLSTGVTTAQMYFFPALKTKVCFKGFQAYPELSVIYAAVNTVGCGASVWMYVYIFRLTLKSRQMKIGRQSKTRIYDVVLIRVGMILSCLVGLTLPANILALLAIVSGGNDVTLPLFLLLSVLQALLDPVLYTISTVRFVNWVKHKCKCLTFEN